MLFDGAVVEDEARVVQRRWSVPARGSSDGAVVYDAVVGDRAVVGAHCELRRGHAGLAGRRAAAARGAVLPGRLTRPVRPGRADGAVREWRPAFRLDLGRGARPAAPRPGRPDLARDGRVGAVWRAGTTPDGPATTAAAPPRRRHGRHARVGAGRGVGARRAARPARRAATTRARSSRTTRWSPTRTGGCPGCGSAPRGGCGTCWCPRCWSRRSPAPRRAGRGASCAGASAIPRPARRPRACGCRRRPAQIRAVPDWEWHRAGVDSARRRAILACAAVAHRLENACALGGERGPGAAAPGARDRGLDRGRGRPAGLGRPGRGQRRRLPHPDPGRLGAARAPARRRRRCCRCSRPYAPQRQRAVRYVELSGFRKPRFGPRFSPRDYRAM